MKHNLETLALCLIGIALAAVAIVIGAILAIATL